MTNRKANSLLWLVVALVISIAAMAIIGTVAIPENESSYGIMGGGSWGWGMGFMALPAIILILIIVVAMGGLEERPTYNTYPAYVPPRQSPLDILNQRYAQGDISDDEYERIRAKLGKG